MADLLASNGLVPADKLALVRGDVDPAPRARADRGHSISVGGRNPEGGAGRPRQHQGIDELRLATRHPLELGVGARDDIIAEIRRLVRASEAFGARAAVEEELAAEAEEEEADDLEIEDGVSDAPLVRLVNSKVASGLTSIEELARVSI